MRGAFRNACAFFFLGEERNVLIRRAQHNTWRLSEHRGEHWGDCLSKINLFPSLRVSRLQPNFRVEHPREERRDQHPHLSPLTLVLILAAFFVTPRNE